MHLPFRSSVPNEVDSFIPFSDNLGVLSCLFSFSLVDPGPDVIRRARWRRCLTLTHKLLTRELATRELVTCEIAG